MRVEPSAAAIQDLMWQHVGLFRDHDGLQRASRQLEQAWCAADAAVRDGAAIDADGWRTFSLLTVGMLIARAALRRQESRGAHYRSDFPERDDIHWKKRVFEARDGS